MQGPSGSILRLLKQSDRGMTVEELCDALHVSPMAVHRPLASLEDRGYVTAETLHLQTKGRPARVYKITPAADELFPKNYGDLLLDLLQELSIRDGSVRIRKLFDRMFKRSANALRDRVNGKDLSGRVETAAQILNDNHYMTEHSQIGANKFLIKMLNCPISKVARAFPQTCSCEQQYLSEALDAKVKRDRHILKGQNHCSYIVEKK